MEPLCPSPPRAAGCPASWSVDGPGADTASAPVHTAVESWCKRRVVCALRFRTAARSMLRAPLASSGRGVTSQPSSSPTVARSARGGRLGPWLAAERGVRERRLRQQLGVEGPVRRWDAGLAAPRFFARHLGAGGAGLAVGEAVTPAGPGSGATGRVSSGPCWASSSWAEPQLVLGCERVKQLGHGHLKGHRPGERASAAWATYVSF